MFAQAHAHRSCRSMNGRSVGSVCRSSKVRSVSPIVPAKTKTTDTKSSPDMPAQSQDERLAAVARLLAAGFLRLRSNGASDRGASGDGSEVRLDFSPSKSGAEGCYTRPEDRP